MLSFRVIHYSSSNVSDYIDTFQELVCNCSIMQGLHWAKRLNPRLWLSCAITVNAACSVAELDALSKRKVKENPFRF